MDIGEPAERSHNQERGWDTQRDSQGAAIEYLRDHNSLVLGKHRLSGKDLDHSAVDCGGGGSAVRIRFYIIFYL